MVPGYAELHCLSHFTFLRGASSPEELVERAAGLGYSALALTDECSVAGIVRAHVAAREVKLHLVTGSEFTLADGLRLVLLVKTLAGYEKLCELITTGRRAAPKGEYRLTREDFPASTEGLLALWLPGDEPRDEEGAWVAARFPGEAWVACELTRGGDDAARLQQLEALGDRLGLACVAAGGVHMHARERKRLQDVLTAVRLGKPIAEVGRELLPNGERYLRSIGRIAKVHPARTMITTLEIAARCSFSGRARPPACASSRARASSAATRAARRRRCSPPSSTSSG
jgi:error-prone DNA polymerase